MLPSDHTWKSYQVRLARLLLKVIGWRVSGEMPIAIPKFVIAAGPHTAKRDLLLFLAAVIASGRRIRWLTTDIAMRFPYRGVMLKLGAIIIKYKQKNSLVGPLIEMFDESQYMILAMAPEGNIYKEQYWKSGFYRIALGAGIPVIPFSLNFATKEMRWGHALTLTGDVKADMSAFRQHFEGVVAKYPARTGAVRLKDEDAP